MTTIVKAANAAQFLSLVPKMLGYRPTRSVVLIPFAGSRSIGAMRFDLPGSSDTDEIDRVAATLIGMVCRCRSHAVAAVAYTDAAFGDGGMPHRDLIKALERRADACGIRMTDALCVATDAGAPISTRMPDAGRPLDELGDEPCGAEHLSIADGDQGSGSELPVVDLAEKERTAGALLALEAAVPCCAVEAAAAASERHPVRAGCRAIPGRHRRVDGWTRRPSPRCARSTTCRCSSKTRCRGMLTTLAPFDAAASSGVSHGRRCATSLVQLVLRHVLLRRGARRRRVALGVGPGASGAAGDADARGG